MKMIIKAAVFPLLLLSVFACQRESNWIEFRGDKGRGITAQSITPPLGIKWKIKLQNEDARERTFNPPIIYEDTIYFGSSDGNIYAFDINSGYMRWVYKTRAPINSVPYADETKVYIGSSDGDLYAIYRDSGEAAWVFSTGAPVNCTVQKYKDMIIVITDGGNVHFLTENGEEIKRIPNPHWVSYSFQVYDGVLYFGPGPEVDLPAYFGAYDIDQDKFLWVIDPQDSYPTWYSFPGIKGDTVYYATSSGGIDEWQLIYYAVDRKSGRVRWSRYESTVFGAKDPFERGEMYWQNLDILDYLAPAVWKNLVIYTNGDAVVRAFHNSNGQVAWEKKYDRSISSAPIVAGSRLYFGLRKNELDKAKLICTSAEDGRWLWDMELDGDILSAPVVAGRWMVFGTDENYFYVLEEVF